MNSKAIAIALIDIRASYTASRDKRGFFFPKQQILIEEEKIERKQNKRPQLISFRIIYS